MRASRPESAEPALFLGVLGRRLSPTILTATFRRYTDAAGVAKHKRITPHTLRHVFATELLSAGANLRQIQELLGHKHLDSHAALHARERPPVARRDKAPTVGTARRGAERRRGSPSTRRAGILNHRGWAVEW